MPGEGLQHGFQRGVFVGQHPEGQCAPNPGLITIVPGARRLQQPAGRVKVLAGPGRFLRPGPGPGPERTVGDHGPVAQGLRDDRFPVHTAGQRQANALVAKEIACLALPVENQHANALIGRKRQVQRALIGQGEHGALFLHGAGGESIDHAARQRPQRLVERAKQLQSQTAAGRDVGPLAPSLPGGREAQIDLTRFPILPEAQRLQLPAPRTDRGPVEGMLQESRRRRALQGVPGKDRERQTVQKTAQGL